MIRLRAREAHAPVAERLRVQADHFGFKRPGERRALGSGVLAVHNGLPLLIPRPPEAAPLAPEPPST